MSDKPKYQPRTKNALDNYKLRVQAKPLEGARRSPTISFEFNKNNPRFVVHYNDDKTKSSYARMEADSCLVFLELFMSMCKNPVEFANEHGSTMIKVRNKNLYKDDIKLEQPEVINLTVAGIDEDGQAWIGIAEEGKPPIRFVFEENWWYNIVNGENMAIDPAKFSRALAISKCKHWLRLFAVVSDSNYHEYQRDDVPAESNSKSSGKADNFEDLMGNIGL